MKICFIQNVSAGEGKLCNPLGESREAWRLHYGIFVGAVIGDSCSTEGMRTPDIFRLHAKNMEVTLQQDAPASVPAGEGICWDIVDGLTVIPTLEVLGEC